MSFRRSRYSNLDRGFILLIASYVVTIKWLSVVYAVCAGISFVIGLFEED